jgi:uncharacterized membrane protein
LWAVLHLIANGDVASFIFFGAFAVTALAGTVSIDAKRRRALGPAWQSFAAQTSIVPFAAIAAGRTRFDPGEIAAWRCAPRAISGLVERVTYHNEENGPHGRKGQ